MTTASMGLEPWLKALGFERHPFAYREAGNDPDLDRYFVTPSYFDELLGDPANPQTALVFAPRGGGKTALRRMVEYHCRERLISSTVLIVPYLDYTRVIEAVDENLSAVTSRLHAEEVLHLSVASLVDWLLNEAEPQLELTKPDKSHLKWYLLEYGDYIRPQQIEALREIGLFLSQEQHHEDDSRISTEKERFPDDYRFTLTRRRTLPPGILLEDLSELIGRFGIESIYIVIDRIDEFPLTAADPQAMSALISPLLSDLTLMNQRRIAFKGFFPSMMKHTLLTLPTIRSDRLLIRNVTWDTAALKDVLYQRLSAFSSYNSMDELCAVDLRGRIEREMITMANGSPRNLVRMGELLLSEHARQTDSSTDTLRLIHAEAWAAAQERFFTEVEEVTEGKVAESNKTSETNPNSPDSAKVLSRVCEDFPAPIAIVARDFMIEPLPTAKFRRLLDLFEVTIHFWLFILVGEYRVKNRGELKTLSQLAGFYPSHISLGRSAGALRSLGGALAARGSQLGRWTQRFCARQQDLLSEFISMRNRFAHGALKTEEAYAQTVETAQEALAHFFRSVEFLRDLKLVHPEALQNKSGEFHHHARLCMGDNPNFPWIEFSYPTPLESDHLWGLFREEAIPFYPLIHWTVCPECGRREIFFYNHWDEGNAEYLSYASGHRWLTAEGKTDLITILGLHDTKPTTENL